MGFAWRKPVVELEFHLHGVRRGDEHQAVNMRPVIDDREEFLFEQDFLSVGVEPMDAEGRSRIVRGFHFRCATIPCGDDDGDAVLWQWLALSPRFALLVGITVANGKFVSCMPTECSNGERAACAEIVSRPIDESVVFDFFETGVFQNFGT